MSGLRDFLNRVLEWLNGETTPAPTPTPMPRQGPTGSSTVSKPLPIQPEPPQVVITVGHGDTLFSLADKYNVSVQAIMRANRLPAPNKIYIGQKLAIPQPVVTAPPASHAPDRQQVYRVRGNDTLASIAKKFNLPPEVIMVDNDLRGPTSLVPGQWLIIAGPDEGLTQSTTNRTATRRTDTDEPVDLPDWLRQPLERPKPRPRPKPEIVPRQQNDLGLDVPEVKTPPVKPPQDSLPRRPTPTRPSKPVEAKTDSKPAPSTPTRADSKSMPKPPVQPVPSRRSRASSRSSSSRRASTSSPETASGGLSSAGGGLPSPAHDRRP
jgi:LysM repeat protein